MKLPGELGYLTYCLNIHPTQTFDEVLDALNGPVAAVKAAVSPTDSFSVGLRFSAAALAGLDDPKRLSRLKETLAMHDYLPVTVNGFPYGQFHGTRVKEDVYQPDWRMDQRVTYTNDLARVMAELSVPGNFVSLSTVPGAFKALGKGAERLIAQNMLRSVAYFIALYEQTGVAVALAIEPEPACFLETIAETVDFFDKHLFCAAAQEQVSRLTGVPADAAEAALRRHLGVCYDVCHAAVEYEDAAESLTALRQAEIPIHKLQLSSALRIPKVGPKARAALKRFVEPTYLHQTIRRKGEELLRMTDLPDALALGEDADGEEWRVHFHVPVFVDDLGAFSSTRSFLEEIVALHRQAPIAPHLEVETYTWDVLPKELRGAAVEHDIIRELRWVEGQLLP